MLTSESEQDSSSMTTASLVSVCPCLRDLYRVCCRDLRSSGDVRARHRLSPAGHKARGEHVRHPPLLQKHGDHVPSELPWFELNCEHPPPKGLTRPERKRLISVIYSHLTRYIPA